MQEILRFAQNDTTQMTLGLLHLLAANQDAFATRDEILHSLRQMVRQKQESKEPGL